MRRAGVQLGRVALVLSATLCWLSCLLAGAAAAAIDVIPEDDGKAKVEDHSGSCVGEHCSQGSVPFWLIALLVVLVLIGLIVASRRRAP
jgi:hypothetical protein